MAEIPEQVDPRAAALAALDVCTQAATAYERPDLVVRLEAAGERLQRAEAHLAVVGDFKTGKSSLVNALLGADACPVDDAYATTVPTLLRHADAPQAHTVTELDRTEVDLATVAELVTEAGDTEGQRSLRLVEVGMPLPLLAGGLVVVDTPGVGGLGSLEAAAVLAAATAADGVVFVTAADGELTEPELDVLATLHASRARTVVAVTGTDLRPAWRTIVETDRELLAAHQLDIPVVGVSCTVRQAALARGDAAINAESGFLDLAKLLRERVTGVVQRVATQAAVDEVLAAAESMAAAFRAERAALADPEHLAELTAELTEAQERANRLRQASSRWQQALADGVTDVTTEVDHDLRGRLRQVVADAEEVIESTDPAEGHEALATWLERRVADDILKNFTLLREQAGELAERVAELFNDEEAEAIHVDLPAPDPARYLDGLDIGAAPTRSGNPVTSGLTALRGGYIHMLMFGTIGSLTGLVVLTPVAAVISVVMGRKAVKDEKQRQLAVRRQQARVAARKFVDEVSFRIVRECHDTLRRMQRGLRQQLLERAEEAHRTATESLQRAQQSAQVAEADRTRRLRDVDAELGRLDQLRERALQVVPA